MRVTHNSTVISSTAGLVAEPWSTATSDEIVAADTLGTGVEFGDRLWRGEDGGSAHREHGDGGEDVGELHCCGEVAWWNEL